MNLKVILALVTFVEFVNSITLILKKILAILRRLLASSDQSSTNRTVTTLLDQLSFRRVYLSRGDSIPAHQQSTDLFSTCEKVPSPMEWANGQWTGTAVLVRRPNFSKPRGNHGNLGPPSTRELGSNVWLKLARGSQSTPPVGLLIWNKYRPSRKCTKSS